MGEFFTRPIADTTWSTGLISAHEGGAAEAMAATVPVVEARIFGVVGKAVVELKLFENVAEM